MTTVFPANACPTGPAERIPRPDAVAWSAAGKQTVSQADLVEVHHVFQRFGYDRSIFSRPNNQVVHMCCRESAPVDWSAHRCPAIARRAAPCPRLQGCGGRAKFGVRSTRGARNVSTVRAGKGFLGPVDGRVRIDVTPSTTTSVLMAAHEGRVPVRYSRCRSEKSWIFHLVRFRAMGERDHAF